MKSRRFQSIFLLILGNVRRNIHYLAAGILAVTAIFASYISINFESMRRHHMAETMAEAELRGVRDKLETKLGDLRFAASILRREATIHGTALDEAEFSVLMAEYPVVEWASISRGTIVEWTSSHDSERVGLHSDYRRDPQVWPYVQHAIETGQPVLFQPPPGTDGLISLYVPVFQPVDGKPAFFGVGEIRARLSEIREIFHTAQAINLSISALDAITGRSTLIHGSENVLARSSITATINFAQTIWRLAAIPTGAAGNKPASFAATLNIVFALFIAISMFFSAHLIIRQHSMNYPLNNINLSLLHEERKLSEAQRIAHIGSWELDHRTGRLTWSDETYKIFGMHAKSRVSYEIFCDRMHADDREEVLQRFQDSVSGKGTYDAEHRVIREADNKIRWVHERCEHERDEQGKVTISTGTIQDITDRKIMQIQFLQTSKLATLGEMAAELIHELSQPLNIIRLSAEGELLFFERNGTSPDHSKGVLERIAEQTKRAGAIIEDIRIFSRRDNGPERAFNAVAAIRAAANMVAPQLRNDDIQIVTDLPVTPVPVLGRPAQLEQIIINLLVNAHHAILGLPQCEGGEDSAAGVVRVDVACDGGFMTITISDNGAGIDPEVRDHLFEPFFTTKAPGRGTGLGLSISFGIVSAMGGRLEALDQAPRPGAAFRITLPIDNGAATQWEKRDVGPQSIRGGEGHVMVVDDEHEASDTLARCLRELGYRVTTATSASEAWLKFLASPADVVVTDLRMPAGGGEQLIAQLREHSPKHPIIVATGHRNIAQELAKKYADRFAVITKPVEMKVLIQLVEKFFLSEVDFQGESADACCQNEIA